MLYTKKFPLPNVVRMIRRPPMPLLRSLSDNASSPFVDQVKFKTTRDNILKIALVGRPNVGKSTLFNRMTKSRKAIVSNIPGTTRDRKEGNGELAGIPFTVIDTGGLEEGEDELNQLIQQQVEKAILTSDVILFMVDGREGLTTTDQHYAKWLRNRIYSSKALPDYKVPKILLAINKTEGARLNDFVLDVMAEATRLGFGEPLLLSGAHGDGMAELATSLLAEAKERGLCEEDPDIAMKRIKRQEKRTKKTNTPTPPPSSSSSHADKEEKNTQRMNPMTTFPSDLFDKENEASSKLRSEGEEQYEGEDAEDEYDDDDEDGDEDDSRDELDEAEIAQIEAEVGRINNFDELKNKTIQVAIMGRPNVGKSTLLNAIVGEDRVLAGPLPGLTRDSIEVEWSFEDRQFRLVDTAGLTRIHTNKQLLSDIKVKAHQTVSNVLRQSVKEARVRLPGKEMIEHIDDVPSQFSEQISEYALLSAFHALRYAQVVILVVESMQGKFSRLDLQLAQKCLEEGRCVMIVANKADLVTARGISLQLYENQVDEHIQNTFRDFGRVPVIACSAADKVGIPKILRTAIKLHDAYSRRISTWILNRWLKELMVTAPTARMGTKAVRIKYLSQVKVRPPSFALFSNVVELPGFVEKFFKNRLQAEFSLSGIPIRLEVKKTKGSPVKKHLLKQGKHTRRGVGLGESKGKVGKSREVFRQNEQRKEKVDERRRRDTRLRRNRKP